MRDYKGDMIIRIANKPLKSTGKSYESLKNQFRFLLSMGNTVDTYFKANLYGFIDCLFELKMINADTYHEFFNEVDSWCKSYTRNYKRRLN